MRVAIAVGALLVGCVRVSATPAGTTPEGRPRYHIECNRGVQHCYERADQICQGGYDLLGENGGDRYSAINGQLVATREDSVLVVCR